MAPRRKEEAVDGPDGRCLYTLTRGKSARTTSLLLRCGSNFVHGATGRVFLGSGLIRDSLDVRVNSLRRRNNVNLLGTVPDCSGDVNIGFLACTTSFVQGIVASLIQSSFSQCRRQVISPRGKLKLRRVQLSRVLPNRRQLLQVRTITSVATGSPRRICRSERALQRLCRNFKRVSRQRRACLLCHCNFASSVKRALVNATVRFGLDRDQTGGLRNRTVSGL